MPISYGEMVTCRDLREFDKKKKKDLNNTDEDNVTGDNNP